MKVPPADAAPSGPHRTGFSAGTRGALTTAGPMVTLVALVVADRGTLLQPWAAELGALAAGAAVTLGGLSLERARTTSRLLVTAGVVAPAVIAPMAFLSAPALAFTLGMGGGAAVSVAWLSPFAAASPAVDRTGGAAVALRLSSYVVLVAWITVRIAEAQGSVRGLAASAACFAIQLLLTARWITVAWRTHPVRSRILAATTVAAVLLASPFVARPDTALTILAATPAAAAILTPGIGGWLSTTVEHPARLLVITFLLLCMAGTVLLALPESGAQPISPLDAAFTSVSAVCVTGLIVVDTPTAFSGLGQAVILLLIQVGGLGIMTFYSAALAAMGRRLSIRHESAIAGALSIEDRGRLFGALVRVLRVTFVAEVVGAAALFLAFLAHGDAAGTAAWRGVFTAVSAFCNAGFALQTNNLIPYAGDPVVVHTVATLIVLGGLSPAVVVAIPSVARRRPVPLQVRLVLATTAGLLLFGFVAFAAFEWTNTLGSMSFWDRLQNAWFQSVTLRTAGFNTVDIGATHSATQTLMVAMMFIGGSPGGTAGGVKTTTLAVLLLAVAAALRGHSTATAFNRQVRHVSVYKAAAVITIGLLATVGALVALQLTQVIPLDDLVFEVVSALGTVGLSTGATPDLDSVGRVLIMLCMFAGRVGPLTLFLFLTEHGIRPSWAFAEEDVDVG